MFSRSLSFRSLLLPLLSLAALAPAQTLKIFGDSDYINLVPASLGVVKQVAVGGQHVLALKSDGTVRAWGNHVFDQNDVPAGLSGVVQVATGYNHSLALKSNGTVVAWGLDDYGQSTVPAGLTGVVQIAGGIRHSVALKSDGTVVAWGGNGDNQCSVPAGLTNVVQIAAGGIHTMALKADGTVVAWGSNNYGQRTIPAGLSGVVQLSGGYFHSVALKSDGTVVAWGWNSWNQSIVPAGLTGVQSVSAGGNHTVAYKTDGSIVAWGRDYEGQISALAGLPPALSAVAGQGLNIAVLLPVGVEVDQHVIQSGGITTGRVTLVDAPGPGGANIALSAESPSVHVPATVFVPAGAHTATFPVTTDVLATPLVKSHIYAIRGGFTYSTELSLYAVSGSVGPTQWTFVGGSVSKPALYVYINSPRDSDVTLDLKSSDPRLKVPASTTIPAGEVVGRVSMEHEIVPSAQTVTLTLSFKGATLSTTDVTLRPLTGTLTFVPTEVVGGTSTTGYVQLNAALAHPLSIALTNGDATKLGVPASVAIAAGDRGGYFPVTSVAVDSVKYVPVTATVNGKAVTTKVKLIAGPTISILNVPTYAYGNQIVTGSVILREPAPVGGTTVALSKSGPISVPSTVFVPAGMSEASFPITTSDVAAAANAMVTATGGLVTISKPIEVRPVTLTAISLNTYIVTGGTTVTGTVTLATLVQVNTVIQLTSQTPGVASVPATMTIMAGSKTGTFTITTFAPGAVAKNVKITASKNGTSEYRTLKVNP
ncbi:hypothetical protein EON81_16180 [bacterium]|nr:MAG: hypothetical protein EON81_16180 [bacterium]